MEAARVAPSQVPAKDTARAPAQACDLCGSPTFELRCKIVCPTCGYTRDCSDP